MRASAIVFIGHIVYIQVTELEMQRLILTILWALSWLPVARIAAQTSMEGGARAAALGGATSPLAGEVEGFANPASWATITGFGLSFFASQAFGLPELRLGSVHLVQPTRLGTLAGGARTFGYDAYRETLLQAGLARGFRVGTTRTVHLGIRLQYVRQAIAGYGGTGSFGFTAGVLVNTLPGVRFGFAAANPLLLRTKSRNPSPQSLAFGVSYLAAPALLIVAEAVKDIRFPLTFRGGLEATPVEALALRVGFTLDPARFTAGAGLHLGRIAVDVAGERHEALGWSPAVGASLRW